MSVLLPGFANAADAQSCFRAVLAAMSRPGEIMPIGVTLMPPEGMSLAAAATLLTLADNTTSVSLPKDAKTVEDWLVFHTGARLTAQPTADFVLAHELPRLASLRQGTADEPETSATLILQLGSLNSGRRARLWGPGIETVKQLDLPLDDGFIREWQMQRRRNPLGVDVLLCSAAQMVALPRSVTIEAG